MTHPSPLRSDPAKLTRQRSAGRTWVVVSILLAVAILITLLLQRLPGPQVAHDVPPTSYLLVPPALFVSFYLSVLFHELGHLVAATLLRFRFVFLTIGPLSLERQADGFSLRYRPRRWLLLGGESYCVPTVAGAVRLQQLLFVAAGPAASILQLLLLTGLRWAWQGQAVSFWNYQLLAWSSLFSVLLILVSLLPLPLPGNDALQLRRLLRQPFTVRHKNLMLLRAASVSGQRPREYNEKWLAEALARRDRSWEEWFANSLAYLHALDRREVKQAAAHLGRCLELGPTVALDRQRSCLEAAYFTARYRDNPRAARSWLNRAFGRKTVFKREIAQPLLRAQAAVLLAEGQPAAARQAAEHSLALVAKNTDIGRARMERSWLQALLGRAHSPAT